MRRLHLQQLLAPLDNYVKDYVKDVGLQMNTIKTVALKIPKWGGKAAIGRPFWLGRERLQTINSFSYIGLGEHTYKHKRVNRRAYREESKKNNDRGNYYSQDTQIIRGKLGKPRWKQKVTYTYTVFINCVWTQLMTEPFVIFWSN